MTMSHVSTARKGKPSYQAWRTPDPLYHGINADLGPFDLDAASDIHNCKVLRFFDEESNALAPGSKWMATNVWVNPPYRNSGAWVKRAEIEVLAGHCDRVVLLVPAAFGNRWFTEALKRHEVQVFDRRIQFDPGPFDKVPEEFRKKVFRPDGTPKRQPGGGNALIIVERDGLIGLTAIRSATDGSVLLDFTDLPNGPARSTEPEPAPAPEVVAAPV